MNGIIGKLIGLANTVLSWLPTSPFAGVASDIAGLEGLGWLNWFIPVGRMVQLTAAWVAAIALWYIAQAALRWIKIIS